MVKWMQLAQEKKLQWKTQFEVQLHVCGKSCRCPVQTGRECAAFITAHSSIPKGKLLCMAQSLWPVFPLQTISEGEKWDTMQTLPFNTLLQNLLSLQDGADLKRCQQYQEGKQGKLRLSASGYRQGRGTWRSVQLNALLVSKAEMGTEQYHVFVMTENFLSVSWGSRALWPVIQCSLSDWNVFRLPVKDVLAGQRCYSKIHVQWAILTVRILVRYL